MVNKMDQYGQALKVCNLHLDDLSQLYKFSHLHTSFNVEYYSIMLLSLEALQIQSLLSHRPIELLRTPSSAKTSKGAMSSTPAPHFPITLQPVYPFSNALSLVHSSLLFFSCALARLLGPNADVADVKACVWHFPIFLPCHSIGEPQSITAL
jgi:hypothetical protein